MPGAQDYIPSYLAPVLRPVAPSADLVTPAQVAARLQGEVGAPGPIGTFFDWISRPGWAVRSLLTGDVGGAALNSAQFALDLPTGGFLNRSLSLANLANLPSALGLADSDWAPAGDLTAGAHRPEATDVLREWGAPAPRSGAGRLAVDLVGGMVTDPLTFLALPFKAPQIAGRVAQARGTLRALMQRSPEGIDALRAGTQQAFEEFAASARRTAGAVASPPTGPYAEVAAEAERFRDVVTGAASLDDAIAALGQAQRPAGEIAGLRNIVEGRAAEIAAFDNPGLHAKLTGKAHEWFPNEFRSQLYQSLKGQGDSTPEWLDGARLLAPEASLDDAVTDLFSQMESRLAGLNLIRPRPGSPGFGNPRVFAGTSPDFAKAQEVFEVGRRLVARIEDARFAAWRNLTGVDVGQPALHWVDEATNTVKVTPAGLPDPASIVRALGRVEIPRFRLSGSTAQSDAAILSAAIDDLGGRRLIRHPYKLRVEIPGTNAYRVLDVAENVWGSIFAWGTAPGWAHKFAKHFAPEFTARRLEPAAADAGRWVAEKLYDKRILARIPGVEALWRPFQTGENADTATGADRILHHLFAEGSEFDDAQKRGMGRSIIAASERWQNEAGQLGPEVPTEMQAQRLAEFVSEQFAGTTPMERRGIELQDDVAAATAAATAARDRAGAARSRADAAASAAREAGERADPRAAEAAEAAAKAADADAARAEDELRRVSAGASVPEWADPLRAAEERIAALEKEAKISAAEGKARFGRAVDSDTASLLKAVERVRALLRKATAQFNPDAAEREVAGRAAAGPAGQKMVERLAAALGVRLDAVADAAAKAAAEGRAKAAAEAAAGAKGAAAEARAAFEAAKREAVAARGTAREAETAARAADAEARAASADAMAGFGAGRFTFRQAQERILAARISRDLVAEVQAALPEAKRAKAGEALDAFLSDMSKIHEELFAWDVWKEARGNPFYFPFQAADELVEAFGDKITDPAFRSAIRDVFTGPRKSATWDEFINKLKVVAAKHGVEIKRTEAIDPWLRKALDVDPNDPSPVVADVLDGLANTDMGAIWFRRLRAHARTKARVGFTTALKRDFRRVGPWYPDRNKILDDYVERQFSGLPGRQGLQALLGGGVLWKGKPYQLKVFGFNNYWKPGQTLVNPAYHVRNLTGMVAQAMMDPDLGAWEGAKLGARATGDVLRGAGLVVAKRLATTFRQGSQIATLGDKPPGEVAAWVAAMDPVVRGQTRETAEAAVADLLHGGWTGRQLMPYFRGALAPNSSGMADLFVGTSKLHDRLLAAQTHFPDWLPSTFEEAAAKFRTNPANLRNARDIAGAAWWHGAVSAGARVGKFMENTFRGSMFLRMVDGGLHPEEAAKRVGRMFVEYDVNSEAERLLRDIIPFFKFTTASLPPIVGSVATAPRRITPLARAQGSLQQEEGANYTFLPEHIREGLALKTPWKDAQGHAYYLAGLGLPQEQALQTIGIPARLASGDWTGVRRGVVAAMSPPLRLPIEQTMNRSAYFGSEMGTYRRAPGWIPDALTTEVSVDGRKVREIPGWVNDWLLNGAPWSRVGATANTWLDERRGFVARVARTATGVRAYSVDEEREVQRAIVRYLEEATSRGEVGEIRAFFQRDDSEPLPPRLQFALEAHRALRRQRE